MDERRLPIGMQNFQDIRENHYVYVDKTEYLWKLVNNGKSYFLSRPRRFGKSLLISTIEAYFQGRKELFDGLAIGQYEKEWISYPVIHFDLSYGEYTAENGLKDILEDTIIQYIREYDLKGDYQVTGETLSIRFGSLIDQIYAKTGKKAVVLVDEYDSPLLETMNSPMMEEKNRNLYRPFFKTLKAKDAKLRFVFFTGVTKFSKISVFSDMNQLNDISMDDEFSGICGITEKELFSAFEPEIRQMATAQKQTTRECIACLKRMYDGYHFSKYGIDVYNPFSVLNAFFKKDYGSYWFSSGTPEFLIQKLMHSDFSAEDFSEGVDADETELSDYRPENTNPVPLFYQTGYLTIDGYDPKFRTYHLKFPDKEVKDGFIKNLVPYVLGQADAENDLSLKKITMDLQNGDIDSSMERMRALFARISYPEGSAPVYEREWRNQIFLIFSLLGLNVECEVHSAGGRADCVVETDQYVYIFEYKLDQSCDKALKQMKDKGYALPYAKDHRKVFLIGVSFSSKIRNIAEWKIRKM